VETEVPKGRPSSCSDVTTIQLDELMQSKWRHLVCKVAMELKISALLFTSYSIITMEFKSEYLNGWPNIRYHTKMKCEFNIQKSALTMSQGRV
jgi:hypothetical protein